MSPKYEDGHKDYDRDRRVRDRRSRDRDRNRDRNRYKDMDRDRDRDHSRDKHLSQRNSSRDHDRFDRKRRHQGERDDYDRRGGRRYNSEKKYQWGKEDQDSNAPKGKIEKEKPNYETTGKLAEETNTFRGVVIKYSEPPEARKPKRRWRLYPFKGEKALPVLHMHRQSGYLIGRDRKIADFAVDHPSCSKQHAAFQFRLVPLKSDTGSTVQQIRPYIMDLESANGTYLNNKKIESRKYYELFEKDVLKFGFSTREYVLLHEHSNDDNEDDAINEEDIEIKKDEEDTAT